MIKYTLLIITCLSSLFLNAQNADLIETFKNANELYINKKYQEAIDSYEKILANNYESAELYYNLANSYYKLNKYSMAILNYERAKLLSPDNQKINHNLKIARLGAKDKIEELPEFFVNRWFRLAYNSKSTDFWASLSIVFFILVLSGIGIFLFSRKRPIRKLALFSSVLIFSLSTISFIFAYKKNHNITGHKNAIITIESVTIKSSPDSKSTDLFRIHEGAKVTIQDMSGDWREIRLADGRIGWVLNSAMEVI